ncbi:hypothetical protein HPG69_018549 [Diceros bicornis minor]|uniref:Uncharacterized protein n=1 Tax=Diceros bicornis minor TaxID=77932 RepID=A0A7J7EZD9_DICBM|nr:hypothetical protein HPG69_018549 [Diceros bicornis minor]
MLQLRAPEQYWRRQEQEEVRLTEHLEDLSQELLFTPGKDSRQQRRAAEEAYVALETRCLQETERRARALNMQSGPVQGLLSQGDREEWKQEAQVALGMGKVLQSLGQAAEKLRQAASWLQGQEEEMWLQQSRNQSPQIWNCPRKGPGCCLPTVSDQAAACSLLIPFLKSLTAALVGAQGHGLGLEDQGPGTDADNVDVMWTSPLFSTLKKVDIWSQAHKEGAELQGQVHHKPAPKSSLQDFPKPQIMQKEELITVQSTDLSAREFVVYQCGLSILHLLIPQIHAPEISLQIASHLPAVEASDNAFQGSFFYQMLQIQSQMWGLEAYFREAFSITLRMSAVSRDSELDQSISAILLEERPISERGRDLLSKLIETKHESYLEPESSEEYIKKNKDLLLFTNMEHFLKSILAAEQQIQRKPRDQSRGEDKI